jgi:hypothetical protein
LSDASPLHSKSRAPLPALIDPALPGIPGYYTPAGSLDLCMRSWRGLRIGSPSIPAGPQFRRPSLRYRRLRHILKRKSLFHRRLLRLLGDPTLSASNPTSTHVEPSLLVPTEAWTSSRSNRRLDGQHQRNPSIGVGRLARAKPHRSCAARLDACLRHDLASCFHAASIWTLLPPPSTNIRTVWIGRHLHAHCLGSSPVTQKTSRTIANHGSNFS